MIRSSRIHVRLGFRSRRFATRATTRPWRKKQTDGSRVRSLRPILTVLAYEHGRIVVPGLQAVVIVTGSGFIGETVCRAFVSGYSFVGFDRPDALQLQPGVTSIPCEDSFAQAVNSVLRDFSAPLTSVIPWLRMTAFRVNRVRCTSVSPSRSPSDCLRETLPKMVNGAQGRSRRLLSSEQAERRTDTT
jgi:hypothetical protein